MTDKINDKIKSQDMEPLSASDEQLLQAFFADNWDQMAPVAWHCIVRTVR